jgi:lipopolysaccharide biosynthesis protein
LNLELIVTSNHIHSGNILENEKAIVVIHVTYMDQLEYIRHYLENVPEYIDILLTTNSETNKTLLLQTLNSFGNRLNVEVAPKKGRDFAGLLIAAKPYILKYDYVCFTHDKKSAQSGYLSVGLGFQDIIFENLLSSKDYVTNVLSILKNNKRYGLLCVPTPTHGIYFYTVANGWTCNFDGVSNLMKELNLNVSHIKEKPPISIATAFWFKTDALRTLFEIDWSNRFLPEPLPIDGVINHQLERIFPYVAQNNGYLTCTIQTELQAESQLNQLKHMLKELSSNLYKRYEPITNCFEDYQSNLFKLIDVGIYKHQSPIQKLIHPMHFVYTVCKMYYDVDGYSEDNMDVLLNISDEISKINVKYEIDGRCKSIRLDPAELPCEVNIKATVNNKPIKYTHNGKYIGNWIVFDTYDPNIIFNLSEQKLGDVIKIKGKIRLIG